MSAATLLNSMQCFRAPLHMSCRSCADTCQYISGKLVARQSVLRVDSKGTYARDVCCAVMLGRKHCARDGRRLACERGVLQQAAGMHHSQNLGLIRHM